ncbi:MAG: PTS sugar transporter subunit IIA [Planctomycetota bacterium]|nr:PTS sugar transporter subunit IIA [Planctomycetota bacterium]
MRLRDLLDESAVKIGLKSRDKEQCFEEMVDLLVKAGCIKDRAGALAAIRQREAQGTTGIGQAVGIPHPRNNRRGERPMREVIQKMVEAESEAKRVLQAATAEADHVLADARRQAQGLLEQSRREARAEAARTVEAAVQQAEREKKDLLAKEIVAVETETRLDDATRRAAVEAVVRVVSGQDS